jgi:hypothetical protein
MLIKKTGNDKLDFAKRKGYEVMDITLMVKILLFYGRRNFGERNLVNDSIKRY